MPEDAPLGPQQRAGAPKWSIKGPGPQIFSYAPGGQSLAGTAWSSNTDKEARDICPLMWTGPKTGRE